jgi:hypothetical protein
MVNMANTGKPNFQRTERPRENKTADQIQRLIVDPQSPDLERIQRQASNDNFYVG